jgi:2'-5' RNA ligase
MKDVNENKLKKRLFIAIEIPEDVRDDIYNLTAGMFKDKKYVKVVPVSNIHLTLKFLGDTDINEIDRIKSAIKGTAGQFEKFNYKISGSINAFPEYQNARVVFVEIESGGEQICKIYNELENNLSRIKIEREKRKFSPHITVARLKNRENLKELINKQEKKINRTLSCNGLTLFESQLKPEGARYIVLDKFSFK